ncbi:MAG: porin [Epsilonproteobacteria bacterium]|nr:porin [Campylobacterota bacterium]
MKRSKIIIASFAAAAIASSLSADQNAEIELLKKEIAELRAITSTLVEETSDLKTGFSYTTVDTAKSHSGLASAASKVYYSKSPLSIGGYGEMFFASQKGDSTDKQTLDVYRFVPYIGYKFSDNIILNTEIEFEHGGADSSNTAGGYAIIEFMYLDFLINSHANIRLGHFLVPMGFINEKHEPTLFNTVQRPNTEKNIIPSTWHESGAMIYGDIVEGLEYKFAAMSAIQTQASGSKWLRDGRGGSFKQSDPNLGFIGRIDYTGTNGLLVGASAYSAPSANGYDSATTIVDAHFDLHLDAFRSYGVYSQASRTNADTFAANGVERATGGYINASFDTLSLTNSETRLPIFVQFESVQEEAERADGTSGATTRTLTVGVNYFAHEQVVLKADHAMQSKAGVNDAITSFSLGFIF